jgi:hypothetical protein
MWRVRTSSMFSGVSYCQRSISAALGHISAIGRGVNQLGLRQAEVEDVVRVR